MEPKKILSIDDDKTTNMLLKAILEKHGFYSITTEEPQEFLTQLKDNDISACIIDLNLGELKGAGYQLIQAIRNVRGWDIPLFILSSRSKSEDVANGLALGATDFLFKPIDEVILLDRINSFLKVAEPFQPLPFFTVSKTKGISKAFFTQQIVAISEIGIIIEGPSLLSKGTHVKLNGKAIEKIFGDATSELSLNVANSWRESDSEKYRSLLEFDADKEDIVRSARNFVAKYQE